MDNSLYFDTMLKVAFHTLGCKVNFAETSTISRQFLDRGFEVVGAGEPCDVYVLNTCSVTERADRECRQIIRRVLRHSPHAYVIATGCYAQLQPDEIASIEGVDLLLGAKEKFRVFDVEQNFAKRGLPQTFVSCIDETLEFEPACSGENDGRTRAFLKIQDGCDYGCAFCTIPLARGASRSQSFGTVLQQARVLADRGYREIVLTGVNVGDYGRMIGTNLLKLLEALDTVDGIQRIRISSIEPNLLTTEMVDFIMRSDKICHHFHIPLQSGSDTMLKRMRRRYLTGDYREIVEYVKRRDPGAGIGVDVIVGFPGETDALFDETHLMLADLPVSYLHVFTYSERPNTYAVALPGKVEPKVRTERSEMLRILSQKKRRAFFSSFVGKELEVLFETVSANNRVSGLSSNYVRVEVQADEPLSNEIRNVRIVGLADDRCRGEIVTAGREEAIAQPLSYEFALS
ncbi:MAG: tRNA (N(6)-L-threonylcarbamoyladenosine(37)-C(2))-methylthiotransferase MtaB [Bacteroidota bacterium]